MKSKTDLATVILIIVAVADLVATAAFKQTLSDAVCGPLPPTLACLPSDRIIAWFNVVAGIAGAVAVALRIIVNPGPPPGTMQALIQQGTVPVTKPQDGSKGPSQAILDPSVPTTLTSLSTPPSTPAAPPQNGTNP